MPHKHQSMKAKLFIRYFLHQHRVFENIQCIPSIRKTTNLPHRIAKLLQRVFRYGPNIHIMLHQQSGKAFIRTELRHNLFEVLPIVFSSSLISSIVDLISFCSEQRVTSSLPTKVISTPITTIEVCRIYSPGFQFLIVAFTLFQSIFSILSKYL